MVQLHPNKELIAFLKTVPFFSDFSLEELSIIAPLFNTQSVQQGDIICRQGDPGGQLYFLRSGSVEVHKTNPVTGMSLVVARVTPGTLLGEVSFSDSMGRSATLIARDNCELITFRADNMEIIATDSPQIAVKFWRGIAMQLSARFRDTSDLFAALF